MRAIASAVLGTVVFLGFLLFVGGKVADKLTDAGLYTRTFIEQNAYNRIYDQVLLDEAVLDTTERLLGDVKVVDAQDTVRLLREIMPSDYLRSQVEGALGGLTDYLDGDADTLNLYVDLGTALGKARPVLLNYISQRIDGLDVVPPERVGCEPDHLESFRAKYEVFFRELAAGQVPGSTAPSGGTLRPGGSGTVPSLESVLTICQSPVFDAIFSSIVTDSSLDSRVRQGLQESRGEIRQRFIAGDAKGVLKVAAPPLAAPLIDNAIVEVRRELDQKDRFEAIHWLAQQDIGTTEAELRADIADVRDGFNTGRGWAKGVGLLMVIGGAILMALVNHKHLSTALRWPGLSLLLTGAVFWVTAQILGSALPNALDNLLDEANSGSGIPISVHTLLSDVLRSLVEQFASVPVGPSLVLIILGALLLTASFIVPRFVFRKKS